MCSEGIVPQNASSYNMSHWLALGHWTRGYLQNQDSFKTLCPSEFVTVSIGACHCSPSLLSVTVPRHCSLSLCPSGPVTVSCHCVHQDLSLFPVTVSCHCSRHCSLATQSFLFAPGVILPSPIPPQVLFMCLHLFNILGYSYFYTLKKSDPPPHHLYFHHAVLYHVRPNLNLESLFQLK